MRWREAEWGEVRIIRKFLIFPKCINGEWRWLEYASYERVHFFSWYTSSWVD